MTTNQSTTPAEPEPEAGATEAGRALHGDKARAEKYPQPESVAVDGDTRIATADPDADAER